MMNNVCLMGRLTKDPELRKTPQGISVTGFTLAVDRYVKEGEKRADFIDLVAWRNTAEFVCNYFCKGQMMAVNGSIQTRTYQDKNGNNRKAFEVVADRVYFCGEKRGTGEAARPRTYESPDIPGADDFTEIETNEDLPF